MSWRYNLSEFYVQGNNRSTHSHADFLSVIQVHLLNRAILAPSASSWIDPRGCRGLFLQNVDDKFPQTPRTLHVSYINYAFYVHTVFFYLVMARVSLCRDNNCSGVYINDILVTLSLACAFLPFLIQLDNEFKLITVWPFFICPQSLAVKFTLVRRSWSGGSRTWGRWIHRRNPHRAVDSESVETNTGK